MAACAHEVQAVPGRTGGRAGLLSAFPGKGRRQEEQYKEGERKADDADGGLADSFPRFPISPTPSLPGAGVRRGAEEEALPMNDKQRDCHKDWN